MQDHGVNRRRSCYKRTRIGELEERVSLAFQREGKELGLEEKIALAETCMCLRRLECDRGIDGSKQRSSSAWRDYADVLREFGGTVCIAEQLTAFGEVTRQEQYSS